MTRVDHFDQPPAPLRRPNGATPKQREIATRNLGYDAGRANKTPTDEQRGNPIFMASWRRGQEARNSDG